MNFGNLKRLVLILIIKNDSVCRRVGFQGREADRCFPNAMLKRLTKSRFRKVEGAVKFQLLIPLTLYLVSWGHGEEETLGTVIQHIIRTLNIVCTNPSASIDL